MIIERVEKSMGRGGGRGRVKERNMVRGERRKGEEAEEEKYVEGAEEII